MFPKINMFEIGLLKCSFLFTITLYTKIKHTSQFYMHLINTGLPLSVIALPFASVAMPFHDVICSLLALIDVGKVNEAEAVSLKSRDVFAQST